MPITTRVTCLLGALLFAVGCGATPSERVEKTTPPAPSAIATGQQATAPAKKDAVCAILAINDTYHIEPLAGDKGGMARVRALRTKLEQTYPDLLVTHAGDIVSPSFLGRMYKGAQMIEAMNRLDGRDDFDDRLFATFGNHEFDLKSGADLSARISEAKFRFISSNVHFKKSASGASEVPASTEKVLGHTIVRCGAISVGLFALTIDNTKPAYVEAIDEPVEVARKETAALRKEGAEAIVALTHLSMNTDASLLEKLGDEGPDVILGGHEHERQQRIIGKRGVYKADADGVSANLVRIQKTATGIEVAVESQALDGTTMPEDPTLQKWVQGKLDEHETRYCAEQLKPPGGPKCLGEALGTAGTDLIAEELRIRKYETNLGNWVADLMLAAFPKAKVRPQVAFVNSGTLRLNANIPSGTRITRRTIEELFAYPERLAIVKIDGATLQKVVERSISDWTGAGHFLQISGFSFVHDTKNGKALQLSLTGPKPQLVKANDVIHAVTINYLVDPTGNQDGYTMLGPQQVVVKDGPMLKDVVVEGLASLAKENRPLAPRVEGRICEAPCGVK